MKVSYYDYKNLYLTSSNAFVKCGNPADTSHCASNSPSGKKKKKWYIKRVRNYKSKTIICTYCYHLQLIIYILHVVKSKSILQSET